MKFDKQIADYIYGRKFSAALDVSFGNVKYLGTSRVEMLINLTKNKSVIHMGCADHLPLIDQKIKNKNWLHGLLTEHCENCIGVDTNEEAVKYINETLKIDNVFLPGKETNALIFKSKKQWDYMLLGEIIEHVDNPVLFLKELQEKYGSKVKKIIITAPNVFNHQTVKDILNH